MDDEVAFAKARLDEDKAAATAATPGPWMIREGQAWLADNVVYGRSDWCDHIQQVCNTDYAQHKAANAAYIARHDPARALRKVEAGRRILERHRDCKPYGGGLCEHAGAVDPPCPDLRDLLYRWADHPGYDPAWEPEAVS